MSWTCRDCKTYFSFGSVFSRGPRYVYGLFFKYVFLMGCLIMLCIICFSVIQLTGKCSKCRLHTLNNTEFVCMDESKTTRVVHNYAALLPTSAKWVNLPNKFLSLSHFFVVFGPVKSLSPVWLMSWVFLPMAAKSGKLLIIWKYQWEWRSLSESLGTPRWQGDNCYCKLLLNHFYVLLSFRFSFFSFLSLSWILLVTSAFHESEDQCALVHYCQ